MAAPNPSKAPGSPILASGGGLTLLMCTASQLDDLAGVEAAELGRCCARLAHLLDIGLPRKDALLDWNRRRLDRLLVDHLLRRGYLATALQLAQESGIEVLDGILCICLKFQAPAHWGVCLHSVRIDADNGGRQSHHILTCSAGIT